MSKADVRQGIPTLLVLKTLEAPGPPRSHGIARRLGHTGSDMLSINYGTP
jgi:hypothetical protein